MPYYPVQVLVTPAGSDTQIQYNNAGAFGASAALAWLSGSSTIQLNGSISGLSASDSGNTGGAPSVQFIAAAADATSGQSGSDYFQVGAASSGSNTSGTLEYSMGAGYADGTEVSSNYFNLVVGGATNSTFTTGTAQFILGPSYGMGDNSFINGFSWLLEVPTISDGSASATGIKIQLTAPEIDTGTPTNGNLVISNLPSSDPGIPGALYQTAGVVMISL